MTRSREEPGLSAGGASAPNSHSVKDGCIEAQLLRDFGYERVLMLRLRDIRLEGDDSPFTTLHEASIFEAVAWAIADLLQAAPRFPGATPGALANDIFGCPEFAAPRTLWLLDGFDEMPRANELAAALSKTITTAFEEARTRTLSSPSVAAVEVAFRARPAAGVAPSDRLSAVLRVLLTQQDVVISSRPELEMDLGYLTGRTSARYLRLEPLAAQSVAKFVEEALKVM